MRINRLVLESYRGIDRAEVEFAPTGITIVEGDNEAGKTSLAEAIDLVLGVRDDSRSRSVLRVQPFGRDVGPEVTIEVTTGDFHFILHKRWVKRPETTLQVLAPEPATLTGREAHDRVIEMLDHTLDRDLWEALRVRQGADPGEMAFDVPALGRALDAAAGGAATSAHEDLLWDRIVAEWERYWTPTGRVTGERDRLRERLEAAEDAVRAAEAELRQIEADADEITRLIAEGHELGARQRELDAHAAEITQRSQDILELQREMDRQGAEVAVLASRLDDATRARSARGAAVAEMAAARSALAATEQELAAAEPLRSTLGRRQEEARAERESALAELRSAEAAERLAAADLVHRRNEIELAQFSERRARVEAAGLDLERAETVLETVAVGAGEVAEIEAAHMEVVRAEAAAAAGAAAVTVTAAEEIDLQVDGEARRVRAGTGLELSVPTLSLLGLPGGVEVEVRAGAGAQELAARLSEATRALASLCQRHGVADLVTARQAEAQRAEAERTVGAARERIQADLRDLTLEELARKIERHTLKTTEYPAKRDSAVAMPADFEAAKDLAAETEIQLAEARARAEAADARHAELVKESSAVAVAESARRERASLERQRLSDLVRALDEARLSISDDALDAAADAARSDWQTAVDRLTGTQRSLARHDPDTVAELLANAHSARTRGQQAINDNKVAFQRLESALEARGEQGLAQRRDAALTERERLQREHERLESRAAAAERLYQTFRARREEAHSRYVNPFREAIERLGRVVFGPTLEVEVDSELRISHRTVDGVRLPFDQLSSGAREQLGIIARLACASIVAGPDGAPVVLDDTLGWTDPTRLTQMAAALGLAGRHGQVIVLTCSPARFAAVGAAATVRLGQPATGMTSRSA